MTDFLQARTNMVDGQIHTSGVVDHRILESFGTTPREIFVPERLKEVAYTDENLDIGQGRYLLVPTIHARMIQAVQPKESDVVLDIGVGAGYSSAILSPIVTTIIALEHNKRQSDKAVKLWNKLGACNIALIDGTLERGVADQAPYSLIILNASVSSIPDEILGQLGNDGRLIAIIREDHNSIGRVTLFAKSKDGDISSKYLFDAFAPFLKGFEPDKKFNF